MQALHIIKIGGNVIDNSENLHRFLKDFTALDGYKILVHGGGKVATQVSETWALKLKWSTAGASPILIPCG
jgi:acetylglutamate kinase